jgi:hypothetical protein
MKERQYAIRWDGSEEIKESYVSHLGSSKEAARAALEEAKREGWSHGVVVTRTKTITDWKEVS